jgi:hypothetical protein
MNVPFFDLKRQYNQLKGEALPLIEKVLENTAFSGGPFVQEFEENLAKYLENFQMVISVYSTDRETQEEKKLEFKNKVINFIKLKRTRPGSPDP